MTARWTGPWGDHRRYRVELSSDDVGAALAGGEGLVFAAVVDRTGQAVALKMLTALPVDDYGRVAQRGAIFAEVEHPNLMHQVDTFIGPALTTEESPDARDFGIIYTVADWVPGADLDDAVDGVDARIALGWVGQIAHAVEFLHHVRTDLAPQGIVHRDIKPSNIRITPEGRAVLIDFGVARAFEATDLTSGVGTHLWRAPEVVGGVGEPGPASDAWGIGALAYWVLLREPPPLDSAASARERLVPAARLAGFPDPAGVAHHISRLLELQPARRPDRLDRWADELGAVARRSTARRLAKPVAAGAIALVATGLAAWSLAPSVAGFGRRDSAVERTANALVDKSQLLTPKQPAVALAVAMEARHRHQDADTDKAVDRAYDAFAELRDRRDAAGPCRQRERRRLQRRWQPGGQLERRRDGPALGRDGREGDRAPPHPRRWCDGRGDEPERPGRGRRGERQGVALGPVGGRLGAGRRRRRRCRSRTSR